LTKNPNNKGPFVFVGDNFFGSWKAAFMLHQKKRLFLLNCKKTQPTAIFSKLLLANELGKMKEGEFRWVMRNPGFLAMTWKDTGMVIRRIVLPFIYFFLKFIYMLLN